MTDVVWNPVTKRYLAKSLHEAAKVCRDWRVHFDDDLARTERSLMSEDWDWLAKRLSTVTYDLYRAALSRRDDCGDPWWQLRSDLIREKTPVGRLIVIQDSHWEPGYRGPDRREQGVGVLQAVRQSRDPLLNPRKYQRSQDGGPASAGHGAEYEIRLLNGQVINWSNCSIIPAVDFYIVDMLRSVRERALRTPRRYGTIPGN